MFGSIAIPIQRGNRRRVTPKTPSPVDLQHLLMKNALALAQHIIENLSVIVGTAGTLPHLSFVVVKEECI